MNIELHLYASLSGFLPPREGEESALIAFPEGITIREVLSRLKIPADLAKIILLNGIHAPEDAVLKEGDRLAVFPPVAGG